MTIRVAMFACFLAAAIAGCSGGSNGSGVSRAAADAWPAKWCQAQPGMTKDALVALMGPPSGSSAEYANWQQGEYQFNAFLEPDGTVRQLDTNTYKLSDKQKAALTCDNIRNVQGANAAEATKPGRTKYPLACAMVSAAEMSTILGFEVDAQPDEHSSGTTSCTYTKAGGLSPAVKLSVTWGDGEIAMKAVGMANRFQKGITSPYDGIGDEAAAVGPALMIRSDEDLIEMVFGGVTDAPAAAKKIFDTAKAKM